MQITPLPSSSFESYTTIPTQPLAYGTLCLRTAQRIAADALRDPASASDQALRSGAAIAERAAEQLLKAVPRTPCHRLDVAAQHAVDGAALLAQAARARGAEFTTEATLSAIRELAGRAVDAFGRALERVENDER